VQPSSSPDGAIILTGFGKRDLFVRNVITNTLDPTLVSPNAAKMIANYQDTTFAEKGDFPVLAPTLCPDGTRLALRSKQVWAARRNMNQPPAFTSIADAQGSRSIADTAATMYSRFRAGNSITVTATDPEGDALTYRADFLQPWMIWNPASRTLSGTPPPGSTDQTFDVKFWVTTASGGTDSFICPILIGGIVPAPNMAAAAEEGTEQSVLRLNPTRGELQLATPLLPGVEAQLWVFDLGGRRVALVSGPSGTPLAWHGVDEKTGSPATPGIYFYRLQAGSYRSDGKVAVVR